MAVVELFARICKREKRSLRLAIGERRTFAVRFAGHAHGVEADALGQHEEHVAPRSRFRRHGGHVRRAADTRLDVSGLAVHQVAGEPAHRVKPDDVRRRRLRDPKRAGNDERDDEKHGRGHGREHRRASRRPNPSAAGNGDRCETEKRQRAGPQESRSVGVELTLEAGRERRAEKNRIDIQVRLELVVEIPLAAERQRAEENERERGEPPSRAAAPRRQEQKAPPERSAFDERRSVPEPIARRETEHAMPPACEIRNADRDHRQKEERRREAGTKKGETTQSRYRVLSRW